MDKLKLSRSKRAPKLILKLHPVRENLFQPPILAKQVITQQGIQMRRVQGKHISTLVIQRMLILVMIILEETSMEAEQVLQIRRGPFRGNGFRHMVVHVV